MSIRKVFNIITMVLIVYLFINLFIPLIGNGQYSYSLWEYAEQLRSTALRVILIVELVLALLVCILQLAGALKDYKAAYLFIGYYFTYHLTMIFNFIESDALDYVQVGLWLGLIVSLLAIIMIFIGNMLSNDSKPKINYSTGNTAPISGYDPQTGKPIYAKPKGFDPQTGKPIY